MLSRIYLPSSNHKGFSRHTKGKMLGGSLLLDGGLGGGSSYSGVDDYIATTGRNPMKGSGMGGGSLGKNLTSKLGKLNILQPTPTSKKPKNINFSL